MVEAGQLLAELDKRDLQFDLQSTQNDVNISWQNIKAKEADITDTDIINAQSDFEILQNQIVTNKNSALENFNITKENAESKKRSAQQALEQTFADAKQNIESAFHYLSGIFSSSILEISTFKNHETANVLLVLLVFFITIEWFGREGKYALEKIILKWPKILRWSFYSFIIFLIGMFAPTEESPFIHFQFS